MSRTGYWFERKLLMLTAVLVKFYMYFLTKEVVKIVAFWIAITDNQNQKNSRVWMSDVAFAKILTSKKT